MIRSYVTSYRNPGPTQWLKRFLSSETTASGARRKRGRPKADEDVSKKLAVGRKRRGMSNGTEGDENVAERENVKTNGEEPLNDRESTATPRQSTVGSLANNALKSEPKKTKMRKALRVYARLLRPTSKHHDLKSFYQHAAIAKLNPATPSYKGTEYEYMVAKMLEAYNIPVVSIGRSNDRGIDLVGHWALPGHSKKLPNEMPVLVQCKAYKPGPRMIRELESVHGGAPAGWRGENVFRLLVANGKSTAEIVKSVQRSKYPMGFMQMTLEGKLRQFWWNDAATQAGLQEMDTTMKYSINAGESKAGQSDAAQTPEETVALTWKGKLWRPKSRKRSIKGK